MSGPHFTLAADDHRQKSAGARDVGDAQLHWQCVAICVDHRRHGLKAIERHRLKQFIALYRDGGRIRQTQRHAVLQVVARCKARRRTLPAEGKMLARRRRAGRKRQPA